MNKHILNSLLIACERVFPTYAIQEKLAWIVDSVPEPVFTTSLGMEDQLITFIIGQHKLPIEIITLDTLRLFKETYALIDETEKAHGVTIKRYEPDKEDIAHYVENYGIDGFYDSLEARQKCCEMRKLRPLQQALHHKKAWITGLRQEQASTRANTPFCEWNETYDLIKFNPLADWSAEDVKTHCEMHKVPINPLHARGYASIGCEPCTRAIRPHEDERAGRWWWEQSDKKECGLHPSTNITKTIE